MKFQFHYVVQLQLTLLFFAKKTILLDLKLHIDDPVGAVGVHMANGIWGTIAVGLLANPKAPAGLNGLFYTGNWYQLGVQCLGVVSVAA